MKVFRQGDVIISPLEKQPNGEWKDKGNLVLAEGEVTGHAHRITSGKAQLQVNALFGLMILKVMSEQAIISHEEHEDIMLPMGDYAVKIQREWDWFTEEVRRVAD